MRKNLKKHSWFTSKIETDHFWNPIIYKETQYTGIYNKTDSFGSIIYMDLNTTQKQESHIWFMMIYHDHSLLILSTIFC